MASDRRALHAYLSKDAHKAWHSFAASHGVSVSALLEALGQELETASDPSLPVGSADLVASARSVDAERRKRS